MTPLKQRWKRSRALALRDPELAFPLSKAGGDGCYSGRCVSGASDLILLFELTHDYRIVIPLLDSTVSADASDITELCKLESSLCVYDPSSGMSNFSETLTVSQAMRTRYVVVMMSTSLVEAVTLMLAEKQACAVVIDNNDSPVGLLMLEGIQQIDKVSHSRVTGTERVGKILVSHVCDSKKALCRQGWTITTCMSVAAAESGMGSNDVNHLVVVSEHAMAGQKGKRLIGLLGRECISIACRVAAAKQLLMPLLEKWTRCLGRRLNISYSGLCIEPKCTRPTQKLAANHILQFQHLPIVLKLDA